MLQQRLVATTLFPDAAAPDAVVHRTRQCDAVVALIDPEWASADGRPLLVRDDRVLLEIASALRERKVILPVLLGAGTSMPDESLLPVSLRSISRLEAHKVTAESFQADMEALLKTLSQKVAGLQVRPDTQARYESKQQTAVASGKGSTAVTIGDGVTKSKINIGDRTRNIKIGSGILGVLAAAVLLYYVLTHQSDDGQAAGATFTPSSVPTISVPTTSVLTSHVPTTTFTPSFSATAPSGPPAAAYSAGAGDITGNSTCADFLVASQDVQHSAAARVALAENHPEIAGSAFLVQEMEYECGHNTGVKLANRIWADGQSGTWG
ncbi:MAG: hypothetical protein HOW97_26975 [Catenulispora sp.]|nr:hypothetical protein [Catenulispora sp.]